MVISIFWKKMWKMLLTLTSNLPFHHVKSKATQCRNERFVKRFSMMWAQFHESKLQCYGSTYQIPYIIIAGLLRDVRKSNLWFLLSKYLVLSSRWQAMNFNYIEWKMYKTLSKSCFGCVMGSKKSCLKFHHFRGHLPNTVAINELLCFKNAGAQISMFFTSNE